MPKTLRFPIEREAEYPATVSFRAIIEPELDGQQIAESFRQKEKEVKNAVQKQQEGAVVSPTATTGDISSYNGLSEYNQTFKREPMSGNSPTRVVLYMPQGIQYRDGAQYDNVDLGAAGAVAASALQNGGNLVDAAIQGIASEGSSLIDAFKGSLNSSVGALAAVRASKFAGEGAQNVVKSALRVTVNPNTRALFRSIPLREFTFQFRFIPESQRESREVEEIIKWFRTELHPQDIPVTPGGPSIGYKFPNKFDITLKYDGAQIPGTKLLPAFLRDISITYNSNGMSFYHGGDWTSVDMSLSFMESRPLKKAEVASGVY